MDKADTVFEVTRLARSSSVHYEERKQDMRAKLILAATVSGLILASASHAQESFAGIGVMLAVRQQALEIIHVVPDTPASKAGLSEGLVVDKIDGTSTEGKLLKDCVALL